MDITQATHWIPIAYKKHIKDSIILGKIYPIVRDADEDEYWIVDEDDNLSMCYMWCNGEFIKE